MKKFKKQNAGKFALFSGATALLALASQSHAQSSDALTFSFTCYINQLIYPNPNTYPGSGGEPQSNALHVMADLMWKF